MFNTYHLIGNVLVLFQVLGEEKNSKQNLTLLGMALDQFFIPQDKFCLQIQMLVQTSSNFLTFFLGHFEEVVLADGFNNPLAASFSDTSNELFVGERGVSSLNRNFSEFF